MAHSMRSAASADVSGEIASMGVCGWWLESFTEVDRIWMAETYSPMGAGSVDAPLKPLIEGRGHIGPDRAFPFMSLLATWFSRPGHHSCAIAFLKKSVQFYSDDLPVIDRHFAWMGHCQVYYRWRDVEPAALASAIDACNRSISISSEAARAFQAEGHAIPSHHCFNQLRIIEEKRGDYGRAIELCEQAAADGWADDWDRAIERIRQKSAMAGATRAHT